MVRDYLSESLGIIRVHPMDLWLTAVFRIKHEQMKSPPGSSVGFCFLFLFDSIFKE